MEVSSRSASTQVVASTPMPVAPRYEGRELRLSNMHNTTNRILKVQGNLIINNGHPHPFCVSSNSKNSDPFTARADPPDSNEPTEVLRLSAADLGELFTQMDIQDQGPHRQEQDGRTANRLIQGACSNTVEARLESADPLQNEVPHDACSDTPKPDLVKEQQQSAHKSVYAKTADDPISPTSSGFSVDGNVDEAGCYLLPVMVNSVSKRLPEHTDENIKNYMCSRQFRSDRLICLWEPVTDLTLPSELRQQQMTIGDVGYFTSEGRFEVLFNIFMTAEENKKMKYKVPDEFTPYRNRLRQKHITKNALPDRTGMEKQDFLLGTVIPDMDEPESNPSCVYSFTIEPKRAGCRETDKVPAVLVLPSSGTFFFLPRDALSNMQHYFNVWGPIWYRLLSGARKIPNGGLMLVTGCVKASTWASAVCTEQILRTKKPPYHRLHGKLTRPRENEDVYHWRCAPEIVARTGPSTREMEGRVAKMHGVSVGIEVSSINTGKRPLGAVSAVEFDLPGTSKITLGKRISRRIAATFGSFTS